MIYSQWIKESNDKKKRTKFIHRPNLGYLAINDRKEIESNKETWREQRSAYKQHKNRDSSKISRNQLTKRWENQMLVFALCVTSFHSSKGHWSNDSFYSHCFQSVFPLCVLWMMYALGFSFHFFCSFIFIAFHFHFSYSNFFLCVQFSLASDFQQFFFLSFRCSRSNVRSRHFIIQISFWYWMTIQNHQNRQWIIFECVLGIDRYTRSVVVNDDDVGWIDINCGSRQTITRLTIIKKNNSNNN